MYDVPAWGWAFAPVVIVVIVFGIVLSPRLSERRKNKK